MLITSTADLLLYFLIVPETRGKKLPDHMPDEGLEDGLMARGAPVQGAVTHLTSFRTIKLNA